MEKIILTGMSTCGSCGASYPSAPPGSIHKCGACLDGVCLPNDQRVYVPTFTEQGMPIATPGSLVGTNCVVTGNQHGIVLPYIFRGELLHITEPTYGDECNRLQTNLISIQSDLQFYKKIVDDWIDREYEKQGLTTPKPNTQEEILDFIKLINT